LKRGTTFAIFMFSGKMPKENERLHKVENGIAITLAAIFTK